MSDQPIEIVEYDPSWPSKFELEKELLESLIGSFVYGSIEHVGSTSISGLAAKPVIDIMVGVESLESSRKAIDLLSSNGYCYYPYKTEVMHWFCKPKPEMRTHHLHLVPYGSPLWLERITFRDHLRVNPTLAAEYAALKHKLSEEHENDRDLYTEKKWPFVKKVLESIIEIAANKQRGIRVRLELGAISSALLVSFALNAREIMARRTKRGILVSVAPGHLEIH